MLNSLRQTMQRMAEALLYPLMLVALIAARATVVASDEVGMETIVHQNDLDGIQFGRLPTAKCSARVTALAICGTTNN